MRLVTRDGFNRALRDLNYASITATAAPVAEVKQAAAAAGSGGKKRDHAAIYAVFAVCAVLLVGGVAWKAFRRATKPEEKYKTKTAAAVQPETHDGGSSKGPVTAWEAQ